MTVEASEWPPKGWTEAYKRIIARQAFQGDRNPELTKQLNQWQEQQGEDDE